MKKIVFTLTMLLAMGAMAVAQDTIDAKTVRMSNYLYPDDFPKVLTHGYFGTGTYCGPDGGGEFALLQLIDDTITIYGIAGAVRDGYRAFGVQCCDTSYANSYEYLRLYESVHVPGMSSDTLRCIAQVKIQQNVTPVSYFADYNTLSPNGIDVYPMYERYFNTPVVVADSFYIGMTQFIPRQNIFGDGCACEYACPPLFAVFMSTRRPALSSRKEISFWRNMLGVGTNVWGTGWTEQQYLIFPILTPPDSNYVWDTTVVAADSTTVGSDTVVAGDTVIVCDTMIVCDTAIVGGDTVVYYDTIVQYDTLLALPERGLLGRLVGVMPNPAAETAKVVSSFGLTAVEVFNTAGERIHTLRLPDAPLTATLDVRRWPSGTYLLRIHTPQGTTVRKLVVR